MIFRKRRQAIYQEPNTLEAVAQYHQLFRLPLLTSPAMPSKERCALLVTLLEQETQTLKGAIGTKKNLVEVASALADLQYAIGRGVLEFGMGGLFLSLFDEVHRSHMSKICSSLAEAEATQRFYRSNKGTESVLEQVIPPVESESKSSQSSPTRSKWLVLRSKDQKMLKSLKYSPADLSGLLSRAMQSTQASSASIDTRNDDNGPADGSPSSSMPAMWLLASPGALSSVAEFHTNLNGSVPPSTKPQWPSKERCQWRLGVIESKIKDLTSCIMSETTNQSSEQDDLVQVARSLTNLQYCISGIVLEFGMASVFRSIFDEVHRSRMSEACETVEEAQATIQHYLQRGKQPKQHRQPELPVGTIPEHPEEDEEAEQPAFDCNYYYAQQLVQQGGIKWLVYQQGNDQALKSIKSSPAKLDGILVPSA